MGYRWLLWVMAGAVLVPAITFALLATGVLSWSPSAPEAMGDGQGRPRLDLKLPPKDVARLIPPPEQAKEGATPRLLDVAASVGVDFTFYPDMVPGRFFLPENMGGGAGWLDFDGDGWLDLFLTNGCRLPYNPADREHVQGLFRQESPGHFVAVAESAGAALSLFGQGCAVGDLNNDGFDDILITAYPDVTLLVNNGDGTFATQNAERLSDPGWSTSAAWGDLNRDGTLDLYVAHYATVSLDSIPACYYQGDLKVRGYCGPGSYTAEPHGLFMNRDDGSFVRLDLSGEAAPYQPGLGLGVVIADLDGDMWPDVYVANDMNPNYLFHNLGNESGGALHIEEIAMRTGAAVSGEGKPEASMGVTCADFDHDDDLDLFLTHYHLDKNTYYENTGKMTFVDRSSFVGLAVPSLPYLGFGTVPIDYDLDGWQDLFVANGHVLGRDIKPFAMRSQLFRNTGKAQFVEVTGRAGPYFFDERVSRGAAMADYDNDGDEDIVSVHLDDRPVSLLRNDTQRAQEPLGLELVGTTSARNAIGARVLIHAGEQTRSRFLVGGGSYLSASDLRILVGVPAGTSNVKVEVHWPSGQIETWPDLKPGRYWRLVEGAAQRPARPRATTR